MILNGDGGSKILNALKEIRHKLSGEPKLRVGFFEDATYPDGTSVAMVAAIQDFGSPENNIPPRPFFRNMIAAKSKEWGPAIGIQLKANGYDAHAALMTVGLGIKGQLQQSIRDTNSPPLKDSTIIAKGGKAGMVFNPKDKSTFPAKPLIDTGHMLNSVSYQVLK